MAKNKRSLGSIGEKIAVEYLKQNGFNIIATNFRYGKLGEIDIIAREEEYICFIEVKTRSSILFGTPSEAVGVRKRKNIRKLAWIYLKQHCLLDENVRFDVIEVVIKMGICQNQPFTVERTNLIRNAF